MRVGADVVLPGPRKQHGQASGLVSQLPPGTKKFNATWQSRRDGWVGNRARAHTPPAPKVTRSSPPPTEVTRTPTRSGTTTSGRW
ncbi:hypothetical protein GCM10023084_02270 [Streptomyces lacrimifluminis]|uniref:Uncharacterized protein n=1 Tax=Streptomyces lacrimifluminis TaxID=1500077 RepID=A0A917KMW9_9ACTN|nr:hypothetical protein GCM10012282_17350 [Streptomyces lacrimifluminis]